MSVCTLAVIYMCSDCLRCLALDGRAVDDDGAMLVPLAQLSLNRLEQRALNRLAALVLASGGGRQRNDLRVKGEQVDEAANLVIGLAEVILGLRQDVCPFSV